MLIQPRLTIHEASADNAQYLGYVNITLAHPALRMVYGNHIIGVRRQLPNDPPRSRP
jgi:hypothetical protein